MRPVCKVEYTSWFHEKETDQVHVDRNLKTCQEAIQSFKDRAKLDQIDRSGNQFCMGNFQVFACSSSKGDICVKVHEDNSDLTASQALAYIQMIVQRHFKEPK